MAENRRQRMLALLATDRAARATSSVGLACARCVLELSIAGAGATVLAHLGKGNGDRHPSRGLVYATNEISAGLEDLQLTVGEGPCLDTFALGGPVLIADLAAEGGRWPAFTPAARALGAAAVFSFPLHIGVVRLGSGSLPRHPRAADPDGAYRRVDPDRCGRAGRRGGSRRARHRGRELVV